MGLHERIDYSAIKLQTEAIIDNEGNVIVEDAVIVDGYAQDIDITQALLRNESLVEVAKGNLHEMQSTCLDVYRQAVSIFKLLDHLARTAAEEGGEIADIGERADSLMSIISNFVTLTILRTTLDLYESENFKFTKVLDELGRMPHKTQKHIKLKNINAQLPTQQFLLAEAQRFNAIRADRVQAEQSVADKVELMEVLIENEESETPVAADDIIISAMIESSGWLIGVFTDEEQEDWLMKANTILTALELTKSWRSDPDILMTGQALAYLVREFGHFTHNDWVKREHVQEIERYRREDNKAKRRAEKLAAIANIPEPERVVEVLHVPHAEVLLEDLPVHSPKVIKELWRDTSRLLAVGNEKFEIKPSNQLAQKMIQRLLTVLSDEPTDEFLRLLDKCAAVELSPLLRNEEVRQVIDAAQWIRTNIRQLAHPELEWKNEFERERIRLVLLNMNRPR